MSRPRPVEPPPLAPRRTGSPSRLKPGPGVPDAEDRAAAGARRSAGRRSRALRGVREDVAQQRVQAGGQLSGGHPDQERPGGTSTRIGRPWSSASTDQNAARSAITWAASQLPGRRCAGARVLDQRGHRVLQRLHLGGQAAVRVGRLGSASASSRSAVSGVRSRCDRSATDSRSCQIRSLIRPARWFRPTAPRRVPRAARPGWPVPPGHRPPAGATPGPARRSGWVTVPTSRPATAMPSASRTRPSPARTARPGSRPWSARRC